MKMKRFVAVFVAVMMVLGTMAAVPAFAEGETVSMGEQTYESLDLALAAIPEDGTAEITLGEGEYTLSSTFIINDSKNITITGAGKSSTTIKIPSESAFKIQGGGAGLKLKNLSLSIAEYKPINLLDADNVSFSAENVDVYAEGTIILVYAKGVGAQTCRNGLNISLNKVNFDSYSSLAAIYVQAYTGINTSVVDCNLSTIYAGRTIRLHEPTSGTVYISGSTIEGFTPLYMHAKDTTMTVENSKIIANDVLSTSVNDTAVLQILGCSSDGTFNPGDGRTYGYNNDVTFNNCTLEACTVEPYAAITSCSHAAKGNTIQLNNCKFITSGTVTVVEPNEPLIPLYTSSDASNTLILNGVTYNDTTLTEKIYMDMTNVPDDPLRNVTLLNLIPEAKIVKEDKTIGYGSLFDALDAAQDGDTVTLLSDVNEGTAGEGIVYDISGCTLDLNGFTYTAPNFARIFQGSNATIKNGKMVCANGGSYALFVGDEGATDNFIVDDVELSGGVNVYNASNVVLKNLTVDGTNYYAVWTDENAFVTIEGGTYNAGNVALFNGTLMEDEESDTAIPSVITVKGGVFNVNDKPIYWGSGGVLSVLGGTFDKEINNDCIGDKYYARDNGDGTYTVTSSPSTVIETEKTLSAEVTLNGLRNNSAIDHEPDAVYSVEVSNAPQEEKEKIEAAAGTSKNNLDVMDIKVKKTVDGESEYVSGIENQKVTITLQNNAADKPTVYYINNGSATAIEDSKVTWTSTAPNVVSFIAPHFSTYAVSYNAAAVSAGDITPNVSVAFEAVTPNEYDIVLKADSGKTINRFMSADLTFAYTPAAGAVSYEVAPVNMVNLIDKGDGRYEFNLDGINESGVNGDSIKIGTVTFEGYGKGTFNVADAVTNIVNTAEKDDNIVAYYVPNGGTDVGTLLTDGNIPVELTAPKKTLTVNVAYNNRAENQVTGYQNMTVKISGGDLSNPIEIALGDYTNVAENPYNVTFTENADKTTSYTVTIADILTKNVAYTVTVEGLGYRTARHTVTMTEDKTLNFWNNVKDAANAMEIEAGKDTTTKNFLAGDIVKDNNINIYDLSAVVSYFGKGNLADDEETYSYSKYDLNRDGKIDSKDVAYVLVSWDN